MLKVKDVVKAPNKNDELVSHEVIDLIDYNNCQFAILQNVNDQSQFTVLEYINDVEHNDEYFCGLENDELFGLIVAMYYAKKLGLELEKNYASCV